MNIRKEENGNELCVILEGSLDTISSPLLEKELEGALDNISRLVFDFSSLDYISSSGLRVLFGACQYLGESGEVIVRHPNEDVNEVFEITGSSTILTIEQ